MDVLEYKYRNGTLTGEELIELRRKVNAASDEELEQRMLEVWNSGTINEAGVDDGLIRGMKERIDRQLLTGKNIGNRWLRYGRIAAAVLLPIFMACTVYLYYENHRLGSGEIIVSTGEGERSGVLLPDGSKVTLNSMSRLLYKNREYSRDERNIRFCGEGYFEVRKMPQVPFVIENRNLRVEVLGTTFNLSVRDTEQMAELALEEGRVLLISTRKGDSVVLHPNEKALVNQQTGDIRVVIPGDITIASAWVRGELIFRNSKLQDVLHSIEKNYNITFRVACNEFLANTFTGTLPTNNLNEALEVIELSYGLKASIRNKEVLLEKR